MEECKAEFKIYGEADDFYSNQTAVVALDLYIDKVKLIDLSFTNPFDYFGQSKEKFIKCHGYYNVIPDDLVKDYH